MKMNNPLLVAALLVSGLAGPAFAQQSQPLVNANEGPTRQVAQASAPEQAAQSVRPQRRGDGATFDVKAADGSALNRRDVDRFVAAINQQLPNDMSNYRVNEIVRIIERAGNSTFPSAAERPRITITITVGKWTIKIEF
jgi:predicted flavoprotein YhiN